MEIHRLEMRGIRGGDMSKRAPMAVSAGKTWLPAMPAAGQVNPGDKAGGGGFHITFNPGQLPGKEEILILAELEGGEEQFRELIKVLRCIIPYRANSAFSSPGMSRKTRLCSGRRRLVWKPTIL